MSPNTLCETGSAPSDAADDLHVLGTIVGSSTHQATTAQDLADATKRYETLSMGFDLIIYGLHKDKPESPELRAFYDVLQQLSVLDGCIFRGVGTVVPSELRYRVIQLANEGHAGIGKANQPCRLLVGKRQTDAGTHYQL